MLVIGNGESRKDLNLQSIKTIKIGCNAVYRDVTVEHLICVDRKMVNEAIRSGYNAKHKVYTRRDWWRSYRLNQNVTQVPELPYKGNSKADDPFHWGSGPYAVLLAATLSETKIKLVGFDLYSKDGKTNNIYKDTDNYNSSQQRAVDPRFWIYQIAKVFEYFPSKNFIVYAEDNWEVPNVWKKINVSVDKISNI